MTGMHRCLRLPAYGPSRPLTTQLIWPRISSTLPICVLFSRKMGALK